MGARKILGINGRDPWVELSLKKKKILNCQVRERYARGTGDRKRLGGTGGMNNPNPPSCRGSFHYRRTGERFVREKRAGDPC